MVMSRIRHSYRNLTKNYAWLIFVYHIISPIPFRSFIFYLDRSLGIGWLFVFYSIVSCGIILGRDTLPFDEIMESTSPGAARRANAGGRRGHKAMDVKELLDTKKGDVISVEADNSVPEAAMALAANEVGVVVVTDQRGEIGGILSEGDISRGLTEHGAALVKKPVGDLMTRKVISCGPEDSIIDVLSLMHDHGVRHIPVVENNGVIGVLSLRDVTTHWLNALEEENVTLRRILAKID